MAIDLLDMSSTWSKIKAGFRTSMLWNSPGRATKPTGYKEGRDPLAMKATMDNQAPIKGSSSFGGKTFSNRK